MLLDGKVAVVTGAGRGIGRAVALDLARNGARVVVNDYGVAVDGSQPSEGPAQEVVEEIKRAGGEASAVFETVTTMEGGERIIKSALDTFGHARSHCSFIPGRIDTANTHESTRQLHQFVVVQVSQGTFLHVHMLSSLSQASVPQSSRALAPCRPAVLSASHSY